MSIHPYLDSCPNETEEGGRQREREREIERGGQDSLSESCSFLYPREVKVLIKSSIAQWVSNSTEWFRIVCFLHLDLNYQIVH